MIYSFGCKTCSKKFDLVLTVDQYTKLKKFTCPYCESEVTYRVIQPVNIIYTGTGFYTTDNRESKDGE